jgi:hypothetical protein
MYIPLLRSSGSFISSIIYKEIAALLLKTKCGDCSFEKEAAALQF